MSYLLPSTSADDILLMIAAEDGKTRPEAHDERDPAYDIERWGAYGTTKGMPPRQGPGFCYLSNSDNARTLYPRFIYENPRQYRVIHLTWAGWDRVEALLASGRSLPTEDELRAYARKANEYARTGIDPDAPKPPTAEPRRTFWRRLWGARS